MIILFPRQALTLFHKIQKTSKVIQPYQFTFPSILKDSSKVDFYQYYGCECAGKIWMHRDGTPIVY